MLTQLENMIITKGYTAKKEHLTNGSRTACNIVTSGIGKNELEHFKWLAEEYPEICCQKCLNRFNERKAK